MRYYLDCEFDGHNGPLLSLALVREGGLSIYIETDVNAADPWVITNVVPLMSKQKADVHLQGVPPDAVGGPLLALLGADDWPVIIVDSVVDIGRFCRALSTRADGDWCSVDFPRMTFEVHNVECYPTGLPDAVQHNAWWDAMALQHRLTAQ